MASYNTLPPEVQILCSSFLDVGELGALSPVNHTSNGCATSAFALLAKRRYRALALLEPTAARQPDWRQLYRRHKAFSKHEPAPKWAPRVCLTAYRFVFEFWDRESSDADALCLGSVKAVLNLWDQTTAGMHVSTLLVNARVTETVTYVQCFVSDPDGRVALLYRGGIGLNDFYAPWLQDHSIGFPGPSAKVAVSHEDGQLQACFVVRRGADNHNFLHPIEIHYLLGNQLIFN